MTFRWIRLSGLEVFDLDIASIVLVACAVFGICFLADKGFTKIFRGKVQHSSGLSVRLSKRYGSIGLIIAVIGLAAVFAGFSEGWVLGTGGIILILTGIGLVTYYMTFGIFYDEDSFVLTTFGKRSAEYRYGDIKAQQLYVSYGNVIIELYMNDGRTVQLQSRMNGVYPFLDKAFEMWVQQTGRKREECTFHDPDNSIWFPALED